MSEGKNLVGVDIGSSSIKICQIKEGRSGARTLEKVAFFALPKGVIVDGRIKDQQAVLDGLRTLFKKGFSREVALRAGGNGVIIKKITVPMMTPAELAEQIQWEAEQYIPFDLDDVELDYQVLGERPAQGQMDVLLVAAKKEDIQELAALASRARLKPRVIDLDAFCLQNVYETVAGRIDTSNVIVLIDAGASKSVLNILSHGTTAFTRDILSGGIKITEEIQAQVGCTYEEADGYKRGSTIGLTPPKVPEAIEAATERLAAEIQRSLDFYLATSGDREFSSVFVAGGTANSATFVDVLKRRLRVPVERLDPLQAIVPNPKAVDPVELQGRVPQLAVACGLALRKNKERRA